MPAKVTVISIIAVVLFSSWVIAQPMLGNPKNGAAIYQHNCARCHGEALDGNGPDGQYLITRPANFHSMQSRLKTDWELLLSISQGVLVTPMHGWQGRLSEQEMMDVLAYIRMMAPRGIIS